MGTTPKGIRYINPDQPIALTALWQRHQAEDVDALFNTYKKGDKGDTGDPGTPGDSAIFPIEQYGAVGGGADDTAALIAASAAAKAAGGGTVTPMAGELHGWSGLVTIPAGVLWDFTATRQPLAPGAAPSVSGLVALSADAQIRVGSWTGGDSAPSGIRNAYIDGNFLGGDTPAKKGLVRLAGVNLRIDNVFVVRSAGDGMVYDGVQNSTVTGCQSSFHKGAALVMDNGAGAISFVGGYYGTSKGGLLEMRDTAGESNLYPFGPTQNTWLGTIFESYGGQAAPLDEPFSHCIHISGTQNEFVNCNFTSGAENDADCTVLIDNTALPLIPTTATFDNCTYWVHQGHDAIRVAGDALLSFTGTQSVADDGTHHAVSFLALDNVSPHIAIQGEINMNGDVRGASHMRTIGTGTLSQVYNWKEGGTNQRMRAGQVHGYRREGDAGHRGYIDRDFTLAWFTGPVGPTQAYIQRGNAGAGAGLDFYSAAGGLFRHLGADVTADAGHTFYARGQTDVSMEGDATAVTAIGAWAGALDYSTFKYNTTSFRITLTGDASIDVAKMPPIPAGHAGSFWVSFVQDGTGSRKLTHTGISATAGALPVLSTTPGAVDLLHYYSDGTTWFVETVSHADGTPRLGLPKMTTGRYYECQFRGTTYSNSGMVVGTVYYDLIYVPNVITADRLAAQTANTVAGSVFNLGIYSSTPGGGQPNKLLVGGTVAAAAPGVFEVTGLATVLQPGFYWIAFLSTGGASTGNITSVAGAPATPARGETAAFTANTPLPPAFNEAGKAALPATATPASPTTNVRPRVQLKVA